MNCYEWQHQISLSGMSISANCSYEVENPNDPAAPITITISGEATWPDVAPPYNRRGMRCGSGYDKQYARRSGWNNLDRFYIITGVQADITYPLEVTSSDGSPLRMAGVFGSAVSNIPFFISGLYKPEDPSDPFYACGFGVWSKSTEVTKGIVFIIAEDGEQLAIGLFPRIEPSGEITYYRDFSFDTAIGTGTMNYTLTTV
jgi:hypothetical protein